MAGGVGLHASGGDEVRPLRNGGALSRRSLSLSRALAGLETYVIAGALLSFAGYAFDVPRFTDWVKSGISIQPNAALGAALAGVSLLALRRGWRRLCALTGLAVGLIGSTVVIEHLSGANFGIDELFLFERPWGRLGVRSPGRMGPAASTSFTLLGVGFLLALRRGQPVARRVAASLAIVTGGVSALGLIGYLYGASTLYALPLSTVIAFQTGTFIFALSLGLSMNVPEHGPMRLLRSESEGGGLARRLLPAIVLVPILVGFLRVLGERFELYDSAFGSAARTLVEILLLILLVWSTTVALNQQAQRRAEAEREREELLAKERVARAEAERATRLKDEFLSTLSHELRTPLSAILGWTQILKKSPPSDERIRNALDVIERNGRAQAKLISDLLDISRITSGTLELDWQVVDLATVAKTAVSSLQPAASARGVEIRADFGQRLQLRGDPVRLQQMIWNLLSNAVKFTPRGGRVELGLGQSGADVEIRVEDTGQGIAPEFLPHLFERFRQADGSPARRHGGLGIGLSIVRQLTELHGGTIRAASAGPQQGATFVVTLPRGAPLEGPTAVKSEPAGEAAAKVAPSGTQLAGVRMLVVDDEPDALVVIAHLCRNEGASVTPASSSHVALELLGSHEFDVIVSDIAMPDGDGYGLMAAVRGRGISTPAVALTAFARHQDKQKALRMGFQAHVTKPVDHDELLAALAPLVGAARGGVAVPAQDAPRA